MAENEKMVAELAALRKQLEALKRKQEKEPNPPVDPAATSPAETESAVGGDESQENSLLEHLNEFFDLLEEEAKKRPAVSALLVFSLGIVLGRYLK